MLTRTKQTIIFVLAVFLVAIGVQIAAASEIYAADTSIDSVRTSILALSADPTSFTASDKSRVEAIQADFDSLSAEDQATLDAECTHTGSGQPLGRVLESALWAVRSYDSIDNSTTLSDGTYDAATTPALSSEYSKGKSTSSRQRPWSVKSVTVADGKATATITVESDSYSGLWMGGKTYEKTNASGNSEFEGVPIDLNGTFYFAGISTSMPTPIAFSLTTAIEEPAPVTPTPVTPTPGGSGSDSDKEDAAVTAAQAAVDAAKADLTNKEKIEAAMEAVSKLTAEQKSKLAADIEILEKAKADIEEKEAAQKAEQEEIAKVEAVMITAKKLKAGKKSFTITWTKYADAEGYQISYKTGSKEKILDIAKGSVVKKTVKKLKKGKKYTVMVRGYKTINETVAYTQWSAAKSVKVK